MREKLTVVIPNTRTPPASGTRALPNVLKLGCRVVVVDSSAAPDAYDREPSGIDYAHVPGQLLTRKMQAPVRDMVKTPYILLCADDTVMSPGGVAACLDHLERHADYSSAMGLWFEVPYGGGAPSCPQYERFPYAVDSDRPGDRLLQNFQMFFTTFYAVHRAEVWQDVLRLCPENIYNLNRAEGAH
jgi:glycosyltransferase domain-containing protein